MTIKIELEASVLIDTVRSPLPCHHHHSPKLPSTSGLCQSDAETPSPAPYDAVVRKATTDDDFCPNLLSLDSDDDCISLSSDSSASSCSGGSIERRVSFAAPLVTEVKMRPRTKDCDKGLLFYTQSETDRFRQIYREERHSISTDNVQNVSPSDPSDKEPPSSESSGRRRISRVVIEHEESLETFYDTDDFSSYSPQNGGASIDEVFFDNDSFWSGSITW
eukprot:CAMPEP_0172298902 /NCGR_PEP_ID=MMETSP1058-20130122/1340_1 /TAXON_ID=83371 /ORGANISM="Detonula confervacea, Strain CCMP 353" /LENGTH=219 /DNA_ID=CAMNT_0013008197 /DNA_START=34 /DNA_END=690 /DNA_ORIENTATION=+